MGVILVPKAALDQVQAQGWEPNEMAQHYGATEDLITRRILEVAVLETLAAKP
jgi:hypothetical protein